MFIIVGVGGILLAKELYHWQTMPFTDSFCPYVSSRGWAFVLNPTQR